MIICPKTNWDFNILKLYKIWDDNNKHVKNKCMILYSWPSESQCGHKNSCTISSCIRKHHRGCRFKPTQTILKNDAQSPRSDVKRIISLSDVSRMQSPAISPKREEITGLCSSSGNCGSRQTDGHTHLLSNAVTTTCKTGKREPVRQEILLNRGRQSNRLVCVEWIYGCTDRINAVKTWIMLNLPWQQVNQHKLQTVEYAVSASMKKLPQVHSFLWERLDLWCVCENSSLLYFSLEYASSVLKN